MKLNNHGWGLRQMLIYCAIIFIAFLFAIYYVSSLTKDLGDAFKNSISDTITYTSIEENMENAAHTYMDKYYKNEIGSGTITITTDNLITHDILNENDFVTSNKDTCNGYVLVKKELNELQYKAYITCSNYETENYQSWRIGE